MTVPGVQGPAQRLSRASLAGLVLVSVALLVTGVAAPELLDRSGSKEARQVLNGLAFESTDGAASWWTTVLLLLVSLIALLNGRAASGLTHRGDAVRWQVLAGLLLWSSFDHDTQVHVAVGRLVSRLTGLPERLDPLAVLLGTLALIAWVPMLARTHWLERTGAVLGGGLLLAGGWAADVLSGDDGGVGALATEAGLAWAGLLVLLVVMDRMRPAEHGRSHPEPPA